MRRLLRPQVTVEKVLDDGLLVSFLQYFHGAIDQFHIPVDAARAPAATWRAAYAPKQRVHARVIYVSPAGAVVRLSLLPHLLDFRQPSPLPTLGAAYTPCTVLRADRALGLLLRVPTEPIATLGYVHISHVQEGAAAPAHLAAAYPPGAPVHAKVVGFRPMDGLATLTMRASEVETSGVTWVDLAPAAVLRGTVARVTAHGVLVQLGPGVRGLVPLMHVSDAAVPSKKALARFSEGQHVTVRCAAWPRGRPPSRFRSSGCDLSADSDRQRRCRDARRRDGRPSAGCCTSIGRRGAWRSRSRRP